MCSSRKTARSCTSSIASWRKTRGSADTSIGAADSITCSSTRASTCLSAALRARSGRKDGELPSRDSASTIDLDKELTADQICARRRRGERRALGGPRSLRADSSPRARRRSCRCVKSRPDRETCASSRSRITTCRRAAARTCARTGAIGIIVDCGLRTVQRRTCASSSCVARAHCTRIRRLNAVVGGRRPAAVRPA